MKFGDPQFFRFQLIFWTVSGAALLLSGLSQMQADAALVRNIYLTIAGFLATFFLGFLYDRVQAARVRAMLMPALTVSLITGFLVTLSVNPITFLQLGGDRASLTWSYAVSGALNFSLIIMVWSLLYLLQVKAVLFAGGHAERYPQSLTVDDPRGERRIDVASIACIKSAGDYVELTVGEHTYLRRGYIADLEQQLNPAHFLRIHRSLMINVTHVRDMVRRAKGQFEIDLGDGLVVTSGRSYEEAMTRLYESR